MLIIILVIVIALVAWSLHLMQQAVDRDEFSLMLAGTLVAFSAAAMVVVYFLMGNYLVYLTAMTPTATVRSASIDAAWVFEVDGSATTKLFLSDSLTSDAPTTEAVQAIAPKAL